VGLVPADAAALPEAVRAIAAADLIVIGPGSLYTSIIPVLLVRGIAEEISRSGARVVFVMNLMTEPGETDGMTAADHVCALLRHVPGMPVHEVLVAAMPTSSRLLAGYAASGARPVTADVAALRALGCRPVRRRLIAGGDKVRHDPRRLAAAVLRADQRHRWRDERAASPGPPSAPFGRPSDIMPVMFESV
jgi:uncharacterized cofD-like protein